MADKDTPTAAEAISPEDATEGATSAEGGEQPESGGDEPEKIFSQADVDNLIKERLEREKRKAAAQAEKAKTEAEAKALEEKQEFEKLAEKRAGMIAEMETQGKQLEEKLETLEAAEKRYSKAIKEMVKVQFEQVPEPYHELLAKLDPLEQLQWIEKNREKWSRPNGVPATPSPDGELPEVAEERRKQNRQALGTQVRNWV